MAFCKNYEPCDERPCGQCPLAEERREPVVVEIVKRGGEQRCTDIHMGDLRHGDIFDYAYWGDHDYLPELCRCISNTDGVVAYMRIGGYEEFLCKGEALKLSARRWGKCEITVSNPITTKG